MSKPISRDFDESIQSGSLNGGGVANEESP